MDAPGSTNANYIISLTSTLLYIRNLESSFGGLVLVSIE